ncbi:hypothetical protein AAC387_Pa02g2676 [Persea americana]
MEGDSRKEESYQQFLDLISTERGRLVNGGRGFATAEEKKLELRLGPPGDWSVKENNTSSSSRERDESLLSLGYFSGATKNSNYLAGASAKRGSLDTVKEESGSGQQTQKLSLFPSAWPSSSPSTLQKAQQIKPAFLQFQSIPSFPVLSKESSQANGTKAEQQSHERKACALASALANTAVATSSQTRNECEKKRTATVPVVGWPPIRSFRKNIASSSSKPAPESQQGVPKEVEKPESSRKGLFVKINMDGVPIGRKIDLKAYNSYEKLSCAVDELFRGLLAAQGDSLAVGNQNNSEKRPALTGLLDGSGEFTLVYEDNEGDRMLVGDVPWDMFVTAVKRLRVFKSSELSTLRWHRVDDLSR